MAVLPRMGVWLDLLLFPGLHFVAQEYLGIEKCFYSPTEEGVEKKIKDRVMHWRALQKKAKADGN